LGSTVLGQERAKLEQDYFVAKNHVDPNSLRFADLAFLFQARRMAHVLRVNPNKFVDDPSQRQELEGKWFRT